MRNIIGRFDLDQLLPDTASVNEQIKNVIDAHTEPWSMTAFHSQGQNRKGSDRALHFA